ncbi:UNVERIFIED_CONTAM: hypothetical protein GTU68_056326 [Idotea baltica]|nr:hypothetical protein [Idotea baltica]
MVIAGGSDKKRDNKGKTGRILKFAGKKNDRAVVEGINFFTKHKRQTSPESPAAKVQVEGSIHISNLLYYVEKIKKPVRLKYSFLDDGKKVRVEKYKNEVVPALKEEQGYKTDIQVPEVKKVILNTGVGEAVQNSKVMDVVNYAMTRISGQKPVIRKAKKSIANFKLREGMPIGCSVTLRRERMYDFMDRLISVALPRVRDFRGVPTKGFDGRGNYNMGIKEQVVFPEIDMDKLDKIRGLQLTFVTTAKTDDEARVLLTKLGLPFRK